MEESEGEKRKGREGKGGEEKRLWEKVRKGEEDRVEEEGWG